MKIFRWILMSVTLALGLTAWLEHRASRAHNRELDQLLGRRSEALAEIKRLNAQTQSAERDEAELRLGLERVKAARSAGEAPPRPANSPIMPLDVIARDPDLQAKYFATRRRQIMTAYGPLLRQLNLAPEKSARFLELLFNYEQADEDIVLAARIQGIATNDPAVAKAKAAAWSELQTEETNLFGKDTAEQIRQYNRTMGATAIVQPFVGIAAYAGVPVSLDQANQMVRAIAEANVKYQQGGDAEATQVDWTMADEKLRAVLSPAQLELFQKSAPINGGASRWMSALNRAIVDARNADQTPAPAPRSAKGS